mgnify:CR=1 FL=1
MAGQSSGRRQWRITAAILVIAGGLASCETIPPLAEPTPAAVSPTFAIATLPASQYLVTEVIDGDTITLATGERVRYIGINAPEPTYNECYAREASAKNAELVAGKLVRLEKDTRETDAADRAGGLRRDQHSGIMRRGRKRSSKRSMRL